MKDVPLRSLWFYNAMINVVTSTLYLMGDHHWRALIWFALACFYLFLDKTETAEARQKAEAPAPSGVRFDTGGVASVDPALLLSRPHVQEEFERGQRIVDAYRARTRSA